MSQYSKENPASALTTLSEFASREQLEEPETYGAALAAVSAILSEQGGLVQLRDLPTIIIPDLHARRAMLIAILRAQLTDGPYTGRQVFELLQQGLLNVVCVGDIVHSEERSDWVINSEGEWTAELLEKEMVRSLGAGAMIMYLKMQYPAHFYCLRGNHDDIAGELFKDFRKFVGLKYEGDEPAFIDGRPVITGDKGESMLVREWVLARPGWGQPFLEEWARFESALPLLAQAPHYVISHTLPLAPLTRAEIQDPHRSREISLELTSQRGTNEEALHTTLANLGIQESIQHWFYGHSPVLPDTNDGKYEEGLDGLLVRLNNPRQHVFAYVPATQDERRFDPARDVYIKAPTEDTFHT
ncbi:MAG TPA: hypothetical protein VFV38_34665 [Ktedonobacteraceae bacterium]|nr:hypothetical protein [Ktedonobacteraceae bacterium]